MITRRALMGSTLAMAGADVAAHVLRADRADALGPAVARFASTPDLFNGDVGDLSRLASWDGGLNSINDSWRAAIDKCLGAIAAHRPNAVLVAGDLVEGHWNHDTDGRMLFGPAPAATDPASLQACRDAITTAGSVYYGHYADMFVERGLPLLAAVGDHELLDDGRGPLNQRWSPTAVRPDGEPDNRYHLVPHCKQVWASHFTFSGRRPLFKNRPVGTAAEGTAYALDIGPKLTVITVDVFTHHAGGVRLGVFGGQLRWLRRTIRTAKRQGRVVIVQGHIPMLQKYRRIVSGNLHLPEGAQSTLYRALLEEGADFYLCGEVHDTTAITRRSSSGRLRGPVQISHGSIFRYAFNFLIGTVYASGAVAFDYYEMSVEEASESRLMWSADAEKRQRTTIEYGDPVHRGRLLVQGDLVLQRTGKLVGYDGDVEHDPWRYQGNLHPGIVHDLGGTGDDGGLFA